MNFSLELSDVLCLPCSQFSTSLSWQISLHRKILNISRLLDHKGQGFFLRRVPARSGTSWVKKTGKPIDARNVDFDVSARPYVQTWKGKGSPKVTRRGRRMPSFLGRKLCSAFGQPAFFLVVA